MNSEAPEPIAKDAAPAVGVTPIVKLAEPHRWLGVVALVAAAGAIGSGMLWQKLGHVQEQLARQTADSGAQAGEARSTAKQAQELAIETAAKIAVLDARIKEISELKTRRQQLLERMKIIQDLQGNRPIIGRVFDQLVRTLPDGVYFTGLKMTGKSIAIVGAAESNNRVSNLMRNLDGSEWLDAPNLTEVKALTAGEWGQANVFQLTVQQTQPAVEAEGAKK